VFDDLHDIIFGSQDERFVLWPKDGVIKVVKHWRNTVYLRPNMDSTVHTPQRNGWMDPKTQCDSSLWRPSWHYLWTTRHHHCIRSSTETYAR